MRSDFVPTEASSKAQQRASRRAPSNRILAAWDGGSRRTSEGLGDKLGDHSALRPAAFAFCGFKNPGTGSLSRLTPEPLSCWVQAASARRSQGRQTALHGCMEGPRLPSLRALPPVKTSENTAQLTESRLRFGLVRDLGLYGRTLRAGMDGTVIPYA